LFYHFLYRCNCFPYFQGIAEVTTTTNAHGQYTVFLRPSLTAIYTLTPTPSSEEKARGLQLNSQTIRVTGAPVNGVDFGLSSLLVKV
jgi:hypothetical protein